jgi:predicted nucleic acid-binding protein
MAQKKLILCDSNVLFDYFRGIPVMVQELTELGFDRLVISAISEAEMYAGMRQSEKRSTTEIINKFDTIDLDDEISRCMTRLIWEHYDKRPAIPDMLIAATAPVYPVELFTFNKKDFNFIEGITFYRPKYQHNALKS